jgi:hypothetical protein
MTNIPPNAWKLFAALSAFQKDYAVIGGTATVFHLEERNAKSQRATVDLGLPAPTAQKPTVIKLHLGL